MNTSTSWIVASFFSLVSADHKTTFYIKIVNILHAHKYVMLYYITTTTELFCEFWESYYSIENICEWEHVYRSSSAYAKLVSCFLSKQCYYTRYKVKIDESTTTSKFYNLFQYNFCKKNLWVGAGEKTAQPWKKGWLDQQQPLVSQAIIISWSCNSNGSLGWCLIIFAVDDLAPSSLYFDSCCRLNWF